jgi:hypothetical protein
MSDDAKVDRDELDQQEAELLPDREAMSTISPDPAVTGPGLPFEPEPVDR